MYSFFLFKSKSLNFNYNNMIINDKFTMDDPIRVSRLSLKNTKFNIS